MTALTAEERRKSTRGLVGGLLRDVHTSCSNSNTDNLKGSLNNLVAKYHLGRRSAGTTPVDLTEVDSDHEPSPSGIHRIRGNELVTTPEADWTTNRL